MERITGNEVKLMMEAYASVHEQPEVEQLNEAYSQSERQAAKDALSKRAPSTPDYASMSDAEFKKLLDKSGNPEGLLARRKNQQTAAAKNTVPAGSMNISPKGSPKRAELEAQIKRDNAARTDDERVQPKPAPKPNPNVTKDGTKFERRLPTMAELRAAQAARKAAPKVLSRAEIENRAIKAGVNAGKSAPKPVAKPAPNPVAKPAPNPAAAAAAAKAAEVKKPVPRPGARNRMRMEEVDVFDTIKEYLIGEGATEEEALKQMLTLTDEQRTEIIEGSCGSKKKKKGGYGK